MRIRFVFILVILFWNYQGILAQSNDIEKVEQHLLDSKKFLQKNLDSALYFAQEALHISKHISNDSLIRKSFLYKSSALIWQNNFKEADSIIQVNLKKNPIPHIDGGFWLNLGVIQYKQQNYEKALALYIEAAKVFENSKNQKKIASTYTNIGTLYTKLKYFKEAQNYFEKALQLVDNKDILKLQILVNLCNVYYEQKQYDTFLKAIFEAEKLAKKNQAKNIQSVIYNNLSTYYSEEALNYEKSIFYAKKSIILKKELNFSKSLGLTYLLIGTSYYKEKEYRKAISYLDSALCDIEKSREPDIYDHLKMAYSELGDYKTALYYADLKSETKDAIANERQKEKVTELIEKFESEKKAIEITNLIKEKEIQKQIVTQAKSFQNLYLFAVIFLLCLLGLSVWAFYRLRKERKELSLVNQVKNRLFSIIAHDLRGMIIPFQRLGKIMNYHIGKEDYSRTQEISQELEKNSEQLSKTLDNLLDWSLEQMNGYKINPEQLLLGKQLKEIIDSFDQQAIYKNIQVDLKYEKDVFIQFDKGAFHVIFRNLLGNALKYTENANITIEFHKQENRLECAVIDEGIGMSEKQLKEVFTIENTSSTVGTQGEKGTGLGLNLVCRFVKMHGGMIKASSEKMKGTRFDLSFPIKK